MTDKELENLLKSLKDDPAFGAGGFEKSPDALMDAFWSEIGLESPNRNESYKLKDYAEYASFLVANYAARPAAVALSVFALVFGGWITTVNASFAAVPGDKLYPVKLATERMQLTFATSQKKAKLHTEFASRRLDEVSVISESAHNNKEERLKEAVKGYQKSLSSAEDALVELRENDVQVAGEIAVVLNRKTDEFEAVLDGVQVGEEIEEVSEAINATEQVQDQAIDALVSSQEEVPQDQTKDNLETRFQVLRVQINERIAVYEARINSIETVLEEKNLTLFSEEIVKAREAVRLHGPELSKADDLVASGVYREAFDTLKRIETELSTAQELILAMELGLTAAISEEGDIQELSIVTY